MWAFAKSVLSGTVAAAALPCAFTTALALGFLEGDGRLLPSLWLIILPLVVTGAVILCASIVIGLPVTAYLKHSGRETGAAYATVGVAFGLLIPIVILLLIEAPAGYWTAVLGAVGGGITAHTWWRSAREPNVR